MRDGKHVVLCVDDDPDLLDTLRMILEAEGLEVDTAPTAAEGLRRYKQERPDLIVVDMMMEEVDAGVQLVRDMRALGAVPPIYMLSGVGDNLNLTTDYQQLGLAGVLQKPVNPKLLVDTLKARLR